jgi:N-methylhydantoinase B
MAAGDVYWYNDCYASGGALSHSPDMCFVAPTFDGGDLLGFAASFGHFWDIGGIKPGTLSPLATEIFHEGIAIPPVKIVDRGALDEQIYRIILRNSRFPDLLRGDTRAMMAACTLGQRRLVELARRFGRARLAESLDAVAAQSERAIRRALDAVPDGRYSFVDYVDSDCVTDRAYRVAVTVEVSGDGARVDLTETDGQAAGPINFLLHPDAARMIVTRFLSWSEPGILLNHGAFRPVTEVRLREGSLVRPRRPAALGLRAHTVYRVLNSLLGDFAQATGGATPAGAGDYVLYMLRALDQQTGVFTLLIDGVGVGQGARPFGDGLDVIYSARGQRNFPIEFVETEFPVRVRAYAIHRDSGGPGERRGGCGVVRDVELLAARATLGTRMNGVKCPPWGVKGGRAGRSGRFVVNPGTSAERLVAPFGDDVELVRGDVLRVITSGGGGWGHPADRDALTVLQDVKDGFVSLEGARDDYGVLVDPETWKIDWRATDARRASVRRDLPLFDRGEWFAAEEARRAAAR